MKRIKPILLTLISLLSLSPFLHSQDTIFKKDASRLIASVIEISDHHIRYKVFTNLSGPEYLVEKKLVQKIIFSNGEVESFSSYQIPLSQNGKKNKINPELNVNRNYISVNTVDLMFSTISLQYEKVFKSGKYSLAIPVSIGSAMLSGGTTLNLSRFRGYYSENKVYHVGLTINMYPEGQGALRGFVGYSMDLGEYLEYNPNYYYYSNPNVKEITTYRYSSALIETGVNARITEHFCVSGKIGTGYCKINSLTLINNSYYYRIGQLAFRAAVNIGYRF